MRTTTAPPTSTLTRRAAASVALVGLLLTGCASFAVGDEAAADATADGTTSPETVPTTSDESPHPGQSDAEETPSLVDEWRAVGTGAMALDEGTWELDADVLTMTGGPLFTFEEDGTWASRFGYLAKPSDGGTWTLEDGVLTMFADDGTSHRLEFSLDEGGITAEVAVVEAGIDYKLFFTPMVTRAGF